MRCGTIQSEADMVKHCETFEHTADIGLRASGETLGELFEAMGEGLADLICPRRNVSAKQSRRIRLQAEDVEALAVDFLSQILFAIETDRFAVATVHIREISERAVTGEIVGEPFDPGRHEFGTEVKGVTYHLLRIAPQDEWWTGQVILDV